MAAVYRLRPFRLGQDARTSGRGAAMQICGFTSAEANWSRGHKIPIDDIVGIDKRRATTHLHLDLPIPQKLDAILHLSPRYGRALVPALAVEPYKRGIEGMLDFP